MMYIAINSESFAFNCCSVSIVNKTLVANCSNLNWTFVDLRCVPVTTEVLLLDRNNLTTLTNGSFQSLTSLRQLSIQSSNVHQIEIDTFIGLSQLQNLNLEYNQMTDDISSLDPQTFRHFTNLKQLFIGNQYNKREFCRTTNLTILNLISCSRLQFDPQDIDLNYLHKQFSDDAFQNLKSLEVLRIVNCRIGNENIARKFKHFINSSLHTLYLEATHYTREYYNPNSTFQDGVIFTSTAKYLRQLTLTHFSWVDSNIFAIQPGVASNLQWRSNIKSLDISKNRLGWVGWRFPLLEVARLEKLETLIITSPSPENKPSNPDLGIDMANIPQALPSFSHLSYYNKQPLAELMTTNAMSYPERLDMKMNSINNSSFPEATISKALHRNGKRDFLNIDPLYKEVPSVLEPITVSSYATLANVDSISVQDLLRASINPPYPTDSGTWTIRMPLSLNTVKIVSVLQRDNN
ncbi:toll-like receptor 4 [Biomphalaria glabrata]